MLTLACVYRTGGDFNPADIQKVVDARRFIREDVKTLCLTDTPHGVRPFVDNTTLLVNDWPGWWSKMELFRLQPPVLFLDLDMLACGDLTPLARACRTIDSGSFIMLRDPYHNDESSAVMGWNSDMIWLYNRFAAEVYAESFYPRTHGIGAEIVGRHYGGDQEYIRREVKPTKHIKYVQDIIPGVYSYKVDVVPNGEPPADSRLIVYHGLPRPEDNDLCIDLRLKSPEAAR